MSVDRGVVARAGFRIAGIARVAARVRAVTVATVMVAVVLLRERRARSETIVGGVAAVAPVAAAAPVGTSPVCSATAV